MIFKDNLESFRVHDGSARSDCERQLNELFRLLEFDHLVLNLEERAWFFLESSLVILIKVFESSAIGNRDQVAKMIRGLYFGFGAIEKHEKIGGTGHDILESRTDVSDTE